MLRSLIHGGILFAASFCAVLLSACYVPLFSDPLDSGDLPDEVFDENAYASLLKSGAMFDFDEKFIIEFSENKYPEFYNYSEKKKKNVDRYTLYGTITYFRPEGPGEGPWETVLPVLLVPFRSADKVFFRVMVDYVYLMMENNIDYSFVLMSHPYSYLFGAEAKDDGWDIRFVEFASPDLRTGKAVKHSDKVELHDSGIVMNSSGDILEMLKDPKNYELGGGFNLRPVPEGKLDELKAAMREEVAEKAKESSRKSKAESQDGSPAESSADAPAESSADAAAASPGAPAEKTEASPRDVPGKKVKIDPAG